jgi:phage terminase large subunit
MGYDSEKDEFKYQGVEYDVIFIDEATQFSERTFKYLASCLRGVNPDFPRRMYLTCNPGGVGHSWVKRLFIDRKYTAGEDGDEYVMYRSLVTDNKALMERDPEYIRQLEALPPKLRKAWLDGDWDIYEGQYFNEFVNDPDHYEDKRWTHVINPVKIRPNWTIYRGFDWGSYRPFSVRW